MNCAGLLAFTTNDHWVPKIGDPTFIGWFIAISYLLTALLCAAAAQSSARESEAKNADRLSPLQTGKRFWFGFTLLMLFLGINKQLDLQTWLTLTGRHLAQQGGWYEARRSVQAIFIFLIAAGGLVLLLTVWRAARRSIARYRLALLGGVFLLCFVLIRAASFHHVDHLLGFNFGKLRLNHLLELTGIFWVALAAGLAWRPLQNSGYPQTTNHKP